MQSENERLASDFEKANQRISILEEESKYLNDLIDQEKASHYESLKKIHLQLDP